MVLRELTREEICDILYGCTILGTGGGGRLEEGLQMIDRAMGEGRTIRMADLDEFGGDDLLISPYYCGSISPDEAAAGEKAGFKIDGDTAVTAVRAAEDYLRRPIAGLVATELGGANTAVAFYAAAMLGKVVADGDPAGRSVPMLQHSTYFLNNVPMTPMAVANKRGDIAIFTRVQDDYSAEALVRRFAAESGNIIAVADHCVDAATARESLIRGSITLAGQLGGVYRKALENGEDTAAKVAEAGKGRVVFRGVLDQQVWDDRDGFTYGDLFFSGSGEYAGRKLRLWIQNENIMSWLDEIPYVTVPELLSVFDNHTGEVVTNPYYSEKMSLTVIGLPAPAQWETERGLALLGPRSFGFDVDYAPKLKR